LSVQVEKEAITPKIPEEKEAQSANLRKKRSKTKGANPHETSDV
jgi:hypothetical protein